MSTTTPSATAAESIESELLRRHRAAAMTVAGFIALTLVLTAVAFVGRRFIHPQGDPTFTMILWITIVVFALGSFALRRTRFNAMRLQDVAALRGLSGLLRTLQNTTVQVAALGGAISLMGFIVTLLTGDPYDMLRAAGVALIVLIYCYPLRNAWQRVVRGIQQTGDANEGAPAKGKIA